MIYKILPKLFIKRVPTELTALQIFEANPIDVPYIAAPWAAIINDERLDEAQQLLRSMRIKAGAFTICQHISYHRIIPILKELNLRALFTPHVCKDHAINVLPFPHIAKHSGDPQEKTIHYSFIGAPTHRVREAIFKMPKRQDVVIKRRGQWHWDSSPSVIQENEEEYVSVLRRSRFSLCPRGTGASTIRLWESLRAGAIPVILSDALRLPRTVNWHHCVIRIPEKRVDDVHKVISHISPDHEAELRQNCYKAYELNSGINLVKCIRVYFGNIM